MKLSLTAQEIREKAQMIIQGISSRDAQVFTSRNGKHYMENWDWFQGVALFGLYEFYRDTGDKGVLDYLVNWFDEHIAEGLPEKNINSMCPLLTLSYLYEITGKESYMDLCREWAEYAMNELPRTIEGGFQLSGDAAADDALIGDNQHPLNVLFGEHRTQFGAAAEDFRLPVGKNGQCGSQNELNSAAVNGFDGIHCSPS